MKSEVSVCFVQNYLGILEGEDVVSDMLVTRNQAKIDSWLLEHVQEGQELGYKPEESVDSFVGMNDYELIMSKGNEIEGYTSYGIICRTCIVEE